MRPSLTPADHDTQEQLRRLSRRMQVACWVLLVVLPIALIMYWATADEGTLAAHTHLPAGSIVGLLATWQRAGACAVGALPLGMLCLGIWQARRGFELVAHGDLFSPQVTQALKRFAGWVAAAAAMSPLATAANSALLTLNNPVGQRHLTLSISSDHTLTLFFAGTVWLMAAVIAQGQRLADENEGFV